MNNISNTIAIIVISALLNINPSFAQGFKVYENILGDKIQQLELGDFDQNTLKDIVVIDSKGIKIALNIGEDLENISYSMTYESTNPLGYIVAIDVNKDGYDDLLAIEDNYGALLYMENDGNGTFNTRTWIDSCEVKEFQVLDVDGDGDYDIVGTTQSEEKRDQELTLYRQMDNEVFEKTVLFSKNLYYVSDKLVPSDIDQDGDMDFLYYPYLAIGPVNLGGGLLLLYTQNDDFTYKVDTLMQSTSPLADIEIGDMNNDGLLDVVFARGKNNTGYDNLFVAYQQNDMSFDIKNISPDEQSFNSENVGIELFDVNGDGRLDIMHRLNGIYLSINTSDNSFDSKKIIENDYQNDKKAREFQVVDLDNDGVKDLLVTFNSSGKIQTGFVPPFMNDPKEWYWYRMTDSSNMTFEDQGAIFKEGDDEYSLWHISDLDGDGKLDVIADSGFPFIFKNENTSSTVQELHENPNIAISPNPSSDCISILNVERSIIRSEIYNELGHVVKIVEDSELKNNRIDISALPVGVYLINLNFNHNLPSIKKKILVNR